MERKLFVRRPLRACCTLVKTLPTTPHLRSAVLCRSAGLECCPILKCNRFRFQLTIHLYTNYNRECPLSVCVCDSNKHCGVTSYCTDRLRLRQNQERALDEGRTSRERRVTMVVRFGSTADKKSTAESGRCCCVATAVARLHILSSKFFSSFTAKG